jgi:DNA-binding transcriptional ArsR family regulator
MSAQAQDRSITDQQLFSALADPTRRSIIELIAANGQMSATKIYDNFSISQPAISQHLKVLRQAELVRIEKNAQKRIYSLNPRSMHQIEDWIKRTTKHWDQRFEELDKVLDAEKKRISKKRR